VSWSILGMPAFRESYSPLHQGEEQPDTELFFQLQRNIKRNGLRNSSVMFCELSIRLLLALMKWTARFMKRWHSKNGPRHRENPRNANSYTESTHGSLKKIVTYYKYIYIPIVATKFSSMCRKCIVSL
ncbi:hypothetical protein ALC57_04107, partial [Trachymyrmex cornetzi]